MSWLYVFFGFCLLIILHEAGHFAAAKMTGMPVERFFLFFGPTIWSFKRGETEYGVKCIPLGGYVKINGMNPEEELPPGVDPERLYFRQPVWKRIFVIAAGPAVNIVLAFLIFFLVFTFATEEITQSVESVKSGTPAAKILKPGDEVIAIDGLGYPNLDRTARNERFSEEVASHRCAGKQSDGCTALVPVALTIRHDGQVRTVSVHPEYDGESEIEKVLVGFTYGTETVGASAGAAARHAGDAMWQITSKTASIFSRIFEAKERKQISGIVGTSDVAHQTIDLGVAKSLLLLAIVSLSLGIINLLPILPLDGGHIFWALIEKMRGEPVSLRVMERASVIGFALVAMLFFIGLSNDIGRLTGEGFNVR